MTVQERSLAFMPEHAGEKSVLKPVPQTKSMSKTNRLGAVSGLITVAASLAGCAWFGSTQEDPASSGRYDSSIGCPTIILREGTHLRQVFRSNSEKVMDNLAYQTTVSSWTSLCRRESNGIRMKVSLTGRVVTGPAWKKGAVKFPVHFTINHADNREYATGKWNVDVGLDHNNASAEWEIADESILLPGTAGSMRVFINLRDN